MCPCSSVDRALVSGTSCAGSIPARGTIFYLDMTGIITICINTAGRVKGEVPTKPHHFQPSIFFISSSSTPLKSEFDSERRAILALTLRSERVQATFESKRFNLVP